MSAACALAMGVVILYFHCEIQRVSVSAAAATLIDLNSPALNFVVS